LARDQPQGQHRRVNHPAQQDTAQLTTRSLDLIPEPDSVFCSNPINPSLNHLNFFVVARVCQGSSSSTNAPNSLNATTTHTTHTQANKIHEQKKHKSESPWATQSLFFSPRSRHLQQFIMHRRHVHARMCLVLVLIGALCLIAPTQAYTRTRSVRSERSTRVVPKHQNAVGEATSLALFRKSISQNAGSLQALQRKGEVDPPSLSISPAVVYTSANKVTSSSAAALPPSSTRASPVCTFCCIFVPLRLFYLRYSCVQTTLCIPLPIYRPVFPHCACVSTCVFAHV
jgi:hypothetical protein